jgi:NAD(P)H-hydrate epimerase
MQPVLTAEEMAAVDAAAQAETDLATLIARAGAAVAASALAMLGGSYGRRVTVVAGRGHNGDDGRVAAELLARRGVAVQVLPVASAPDELETCDLVVDAAYGTGFRGEYRAPRPPRHTPVLAVDIASGLHPDTGEAGPGAVVADRTVTFCARKPGLLLGDGPHHSGAIEVAEIGLVASGARIFLLDDSDVTAHLHPRPAGGHKWNAALYVLAGSPGMLGAAALCAGAALRAGSGMVRLGSPGAPPGAVAVTEAVARPLSVDRFADAVLEECGRCRALVVGPGLGNAEGLAAEVAKIVAASPVPVVLDADGLNALAPLSSTGALAGAGSPVILTPHDGEYARLVGHPPGTDRIAAARHLAALAHAVVLLKGPTTVVASPEGEVMLVTSGSARLATAGTGDVLSGIIGAFVARGVDPFRAAGLAAHVHGAAAATAPSEGLVASDLLELLPPLLSRLVSRG